MRKTEPDGGTWRLYWGRELVGEIRGAKFYDMFWTDGEFPPLGSFERDLRGFFVHAAAGLSAGDVERGASALKHILESVTLTDPHGTPARLFNLIIEGNRARFRLKE